MISGPEKGLFIEKGTCCVRQQQSCGRVEGEWCANDLTSETVQGTALAFQSVDDVHGGDRLPLGVLGVGDSVTDDVLQEHLQHAAGLLINEAADTLHATTASETPDGGLGDAL